jgi:quercetin dioxygenase-like cupin family protein
MNAELNRLMEQLNRGELEGAELKEAEALASLALALDPVAPQPGTLQRLLDSTKESGRFEHFVGTVASLLDVARDAAQALVDGIDQAVNWEPGPMENIQLYHLDGGPSLANAIVGFIQLEPGTVFPLHTHLGQETVMVLQGGFEDEDGSVVRAGEIDRKDPGSSHYFTALEGEALIYLAIIFDGVQIGDVVMKPGDPRI